MCRNVQKSTIKSFSAIFLLFNLLRAAAVIAGMRMVLHVVIKERRPVASISLQYNINKDVHTATAHLRFSTHKTNRPEPTCAQETTQDTKVFVIVIFEIVTLATVFVCLLGPLSAEISFRHWVKSLFTLQNTWKGLLWVAVSVAYVEVVLMYQRSRCKDDDHCCDDTFRKTTMPITALEFLLLGLTESALKLYTPEKLKKVVSTAKSHVGKHWGNSAVAAYLLCTATSALRNLFVSLYFAAKAVYVLHMERESLPHQGNVINLFTVMVVLKTMVAAIRFQYGLSFLSLFLDDYFLNNGENFYFNDVQQYQQIPGENGAEETEDRNEEAAMINRATRERYHTFP